MPDHANKGRPAKPVKGKGKQAVDSATPRPRLWLMLFVVLVMCGGFAYFLFYIQGNAEQTPVAVAVENKPAIVAQKPLPKAPTESWAYEKLDQKEIEIELPNQQHNTRPYRLQCGSFRTLAQANSLKAKIAFQGYVSFIKQAQGKKSTWYQVYLGPFERKRLAEAARHKMQRAGMNYCQIFYWEG